MKLSYEQIKYFIENFGDGHIYYEHKYLEDDKIEVKYFPYFTKFAEESNIDLLKKEIEKSPHIESKFVEKIILTPAYAYLPENRELNKREKLVKNYKKYLEKINGCSR